MFSIDLNNVSSSSSESFYSDFKFNSCMVDGKYQCSHCFRDFSRKWDFKRHQETHKTRRYDPNKKIYNCNICNKSFSRKDGYTRHFRVVHSDSYPFSCENCKRGFKWKNVLQGHSKICGRKKELKFHTTSYPTSKEKKYKCAECGKCYKTTSTLYVHQKNKH